MSARYYAQHPYVPAAGGGGVERFRANCTQHAVKSTGNNLAGRDRHRDAFGRVEIVGPPTSPLEHYLHPDDGRLTVLHVKHGYGSGGKKQG